MENRNSPKNAVVCSILSLSSLTSYILKSPMYEGHSIYNANNRINQSKDTVLPYAMQRIKEHFLPFQMIMYNTLV